MKHIVLPIAILLFVLFLTLSLFVACAPKEGMEVQGKGIFKTYETVIIDGMTCIKFSSGYQGALTYNLNVPNDTICTISII